MEEKFLSVFKKVGGMGMLGGALFQALFEQNAWRKEVAWKDGYSCTSCVRDENGLLCKAGRS